MYGGYSSRCWKYCSEQARQLSFPLWNLQLNGQYAKIRCIRSICVAEEPYLTLGGRTNRV